MTMKRNIIIVISLFLIFACNSKPPELHNEDVISDSIPSEKDITVNVIDTNESYFENNDELFNDSTPIDEYYSDPLVVSYSQHSDTMVINEDCVIFLWPDSLELVEIQKKYPDGYIEILDDMIYYASDAAIALDDAGIRNFFCDKSVLQFKGSKKDTYLKRKKVEGNMIFYKTNLKPEISYAIEFKIADAINFFSESSDSIE
jgi:hypothetical protein